MQQEYGRMEGAKARNWVVLWASERLRAVVVAAGLEAGMMCWGFGIGVGWMVKDYFWMGGGGGAVLRSRWCGGLGVHAMMMVESLWWVKEDPSANHWAARLEGGWSVLIQHRHGLGRAMRRGRYRWTFVQGVEESCRGWRMGEQVEVEWCRSRLAEAHRPVERQQDDGSLGDRGSDLRARAMGRRAGCSVERLNEGSR